MKVTLDEGELHIQEVRALEQARQRAWYAYQRKLDAKYFRVRVLERDNREMRCRFNELRFRLKKRR